jgi:hypothetical protein
LLLEAYRFYQAWHQWDSGKFTILKNMLCPNLEFSQQLAAYPRGFFVKVTTRNQLS